MSVLARSVATHKALGHAVRQRLVAMLRQGPLCVCQMTVVLELAASTVSAHLRELLLQVAARVEDDPQVKADAKLVRALRQVDAEELCRVELNLSRIGIRRPLVASTTSE